MHTEDLTPVEQRGDVWFKRDDKLVVAGVNGGKIRGCMMLADGAPGLVTCGSRSSAQVNVVAHVAKHLGIPCRVHVPSGALGAEVEAARAAGAEVVQHRPGYNSVIIARARTDAQERGWVEVPFGMDCQEAVDQTRKQVENLPREIKRVVVPVGSGTSLCGVLHGLLDYGFDVPVVGVYVGADPTKRLEKYAPKTFHSPFFCTPNDREKAWRDMVTLKSSGSKYSKPYPEPEYRGILLDPSYESKCIPFLEPGDLLWIVGCRQTVAQPDKPYA